jgi:hypothetical protein
MNGINFDEFFAELDARGITYEDGPLGEVAAEGEPYITLLVGTRKDEFIEKFAPNFIQLLTVSDDVPTLIAALSQALLGYIGSATHIVWRDRPNIEILMADGGRLRGRACFVARS